MKKFLAVIGALLLLTGCGNKLTCTMTDEEDGMEMSGSEVFTFSNGKIKTGTLTAEIKIPEEYKSLSSLLESTLKSQFEEYEEYGATVSVEVKDDVIKAKVTYDASKLSEDQIKELISGGLYYEGDKDEVKKALEAADYTCK